MAKRRRGGKGFDLTSIAAPALMFYFLNQASKKQQGGVNPGGMPPMFPDNGLKGAFMQPLAGPSAYDQEVARLRGAQGPAAPATDMSWMWNSRPIAQAPLGMVDAGPMFDPAKYWGDYL